MHLLKCWRLSRERYTLTGIECPSCGACLMSPRLVCPICESEVEQVVRSVFPPLNPMNDNPQGEGAVVVSVLVPTYNAAATIRATLSSVMAQDFSEPYEVIVVDSSSDGTSAIISKEFPQVHLIRRNEQTDPGTARNLGISRARGEIIAYIDADCTASPGWLSRMVSAHRAGHLVVGGAVENGNPESLVAWAGYLGEFREFLPVGKARLVSHVATCNISYERSIFIQYGVFPTSFYPQEDLLYHWRLAQQGVSIWFDPDIRVAHTHRAKWAPYVRHQRRIGRITAQVLKLTNGEGAFLARSPMLATLVMPILPVVKFLRTVAHFLSQRPEVLRCHSSALIVLLGGLYAWGIGFAEGTWEAPLRIP
jgi:GT2 family glycosyltransferase